MSFLKYKTYIVASVLILIVGALVVGVTEYNRATQAQFSSENTERETLKRELLAVNESDYVYGARDAHIMLVKYSDAACQYCRLLYSRLQNIVDTYPEGTVAFVYRHIPLYNTRSDLSNEEVAGACVHRERGDEGFFAYLSALFGALPEGVRTDNIPAETIYGSAAAAGVSQDTIETCVAEQYSSTNIRKQHSTGGALGVITIPHTFIVSSDDMYEIVGAKREETYRLIIDSMLSQE